MINFTNRSILGNRTLRISTKKKKRLPKFVLKKFEYDKISLLLEFSSAVQIDMIARTDNKYPLIVSCHLPSSLKLPN